MANDEVMVAEHHTDAPLLRICTGNTTPRDGGCIAS